MFPHHFLMQMLYKLENISKLINKIDISANISVFSLKLYYNILAITYFENNLTLRK